MAEEEGGGRGAYEDLLIGAVLFGLLIIAWFVSGAAKEADLRGIFLMPPSPLGSGDAYGPTLEGAGGSTEVFREEVDRIAGEVGAVEEELARLSGAAASPYRSKIYIGSTWAAPESDPSLEYVTLRASDDNRERIDITGFVLASAVTNKSSSIGKGADVFISGNVNEGAIILDPGDEVIVTTGRSPVGASFRVNRCSGYLTQFQTFNPSLTTSCPRAEAEALAHPQGRNLSDACFDYLEGMQQCRIDLAVPPELPEDCRAFIQQHLTYNGCVALHRNEPGFRGREWRLYLSRSDELWKERREVVKLLDATGKLVDTATY